MRISTWSPKFAWIRELATAGKLPARDESSSKSQESEVESSEYQNNADIGCQPLPESGSEERNIYSDDENYHRHDVNQSCWLPGHPIPLIRFWHPLGVPTAWDGSWNWNPGHARMLRFGLRQCRSMGFPVSLKAWRSGWSAPPLRHSRQVEGEEQECPSAGRRAGWRYGFCPAAS